MKIIKYIQQYFFPGLAILAVLLLIFRKDVPTLQETSDRISQELVEVETSFSKALEKNEFKDKIRQQRIDDSEIKSTTEKGVGLLYFQKDSLIFWTENNSTFSPAGFQGYQSGSLIHFKGGWYFFLSALDRKTEELFVGLYPIKSDFPFENKFLKNEFRLRCQVPSNVQLADSKLDASVPVYGNKGNALFYIYSSGEQAERSINYPALIAQIILLILIIYYLRLAAIRIYKRFGLSYAAFALGGAFYLLRIVMLNNWFQLEFGNLELFNPLYYASSSLTPSLGDLMINCALLLILFRFVTFRLILYNLPTSSLRALLALVPVFLVTALVTWVFKTLVMDSVVSFELYNVLTLDSFSFLGMLCVASLLMCHYMLSRKMLSYVARCVNNPVKLFMLSLPLAGLYGLYALNTAFWHVTIYSALWACIFIFTDTYVRNRSGKLIFNNALVYLALYALLTTFFIENLYERKERNQRVFFSEKLVTDRDFVAEFLFEDVQANIASDAFIRNFFTGMEVDQKSITDRITSLYLTGYFNKYDLNVLTYDASGNSYRNEDSINMADYFRGLNIEAFQSHSLFYSSDTTKNYSYTSLITIRKDTTAQGYLLLQLIPKTYFGQNVYPELLVGGNIQNSGASGSYDYAIYQNDKLVAQSGEFPYPYYWSKNYVFEGETTKFIEEPEWEHTITRFTNGKKTMVSIRREPLFEPIATFSYLFTFYVLVGLFAFLYLYLIKAPFDASLLSGVVNPSFRIRINYSMLLMIVLSFLIIGGVTINFFSKQYEKFYSDRLQRKEKVIHATLEYFLRQTLKRTNDFSFGGIQSALKLEIARLADINTVDINLYNTGGQLAVSSQPSIYERGLLARRMNPDAFFSLVSTKSVQVTTSENIGNLNYMATYSPLLNQDGVAVAYLGIPYLERDSDVQSEVSAFLVSLVNVYVFLLLCAALLAYIISNSITKPLTLIGDKLKLLNLNKRNERIEWEGEDEIGTLINEYNKMLTELEQSAQKLAKGERESAWREMAKQIAHEIKNPLTPMKLSIQYLQRAVDEGKPDIDVLVKRVSKTLEEQIENLSSIASAFASFAKMPKPENEILNLVELIKSIVDLFNKEGSNVEISFDSEIPVANVFADKNQMISVFNNLVKNGIQSIPEGRRGYVEVKISQDIDWVIVAVTDNGSGIDKENAEKVFVPNFTTKSSGTGLGLAITKQIIDGAGGTIWFESENESGTTFFVRLKLFSPIN